MELLTNNYSQYFKTVTKYYRQVLLKLSSCDLCGEACTDYLLLCQTCVDDLPIFDLNIINGDLLNWPAVNKILPKITFDHLICLSPYITPFSDWLSQLKYHGRFEIAQLMALLLSKHYQQTLSQYKNNKADLVVAVPIHITKWQQRGFNQAHLLAKVVAQQIDLPYDEKILSRNKSSKSQVGQSGTLRRKNLRGLFDVNLMKENSPPEHIILIDDVVTTGATASEISRCLKLAGVKKVTVLALCLSLPSEIKLN
ncbi:MAG: ComF family protein [Colwellia sp.]|nr:ComF family protein [Colwellia sp.]